MDFVTRWRRGQTAGTSGVEKFLMIDLTFFAPLHTSHLVEKCPSAIPFLGLPPGYRFLLGEKAYEDVWFDAELLKV